MIDGYNLLKKYNKNKVKIFLENNVITKKNLKEYKANPLLLTSYSDYKHLSKNFKFELLLDLDHLKVSSKTLKKKFDTEINKFAPFIKYTCKAVIILLKTPIYQLLKTKILLMVLKNSEM